MILLTPSNRSIYIIDFVLVTCCVISWCFLSGEEAAVPEEVRIWEVFEWRTLREIEKVRLNLERRSEDWLEENISMLSKDLLVIGKQVKTDFGGIIDLLCLNSQGDLTIVELKRDMTPNTSLRCEKSLLS
jgi:hypothetical protein